MMRSMIRRFLAALVFIAAPAAGRLRECRAAPGRMVRAGDVIAILEDMPGA